MSGTITRRPRIGALERNLLKLRALEMILVLFYVEDLRNLVIASIQATDSIAHPDAGRLGPGTKNLQQRAWEILVEERVISARDSSEIQELISYRNLIAHQVHQLTADIAPSVPQAEPPAFNHGALVKIRQIRQKVISGLQATFVVSVSFRSLQFESAERTYNTEIESLKRKIEPEILRRNEEINDANRSIEALPSGLLEDLQLYHPKNRKRNGALSDFGISGVEKLLQNGATPMAIGHLMNLSIESIRRHRKKFNIEKSGRAEPCR